ncbi:MAG: hypothetical protein ACREBE_27795, partial [bacterium]
DFTFSFTYWAMGRFEESIRIGEIAHRQAATHAGVLRMLIASEVGLGHLERARAYGRDLLRISPDFRISRMEEIIPWQPALIPRFSEALRSAGLPE